MQHEQQALLYRNEAGYAMFAPSMAQQGWIVVHHQPNRNGTVSVTWRRPARQQAFVPPEHHLSDGSLIAIIGGGCAILLVLIGVFGFVALHQPAIESTATPESAVDATVNAGATAVAGVYATVDIRELKKNPAAFKGRRLEVEGEVFNISESSGSTYIQMYVQVPGGSTYDREAVVVLYSGSVPGVYAKTRITVYGVGDGTASGKNAFGAGLSQPQIRADKILR